MWLKRRSLIRPGTPTKQSAMLLKIPGQVRDQTSGQGQALVPSSFHPQTDRAFCGGGRDDLPTLQNTQAPLRYEFKRRRPHKRHQRPPVTRQRPRGFRRTERLLRSPPRSEIQQTGPDHVIIHPGET